VRPATRFWLLLATLHGVALALFALRNLGREPYDDAYFFKRFALHALHAGKLAWNRDEPPVYGSTSQLWQALAVAITAVAPEHFVLAGKLLAVALLVASAYLLARATREHDGGASAALVWSSPAWFYAALSGMESALVLALLAGCAVLAQHERAASRRWLTPVAALLVYLARTDAVVLALALLLAPLRAPRELAARALLTCAALATWLALAKLYYGSALPLPFYTKTAAFSPYDAEFLALCARSKLQHVALFGLAAVPLAGCASLRLDRTNAVLLAGSAVFVGYHGLLGVDVMGMHARFYLPALVPLGLAAARGLADDHRPGARALVAIGMACVLAWGAYWRWPPSGRAEQIAPALLVAHLLAAACALASIAWPGVRLRAPWLTTAALATASALVPAAAPLPRLDDAAYLHAHVARGSVFRGLPELVACFGDGIHVYHSETGVPGLLLARGKVGDLAGLLSPQWLFRRTSFDAICSRERPEAIFLPHRNYRALNREIAASRCLRGYTRAIAKSASPLHVRNDLFARFEQCVKPGEF
jgi:hypothetical protein